MTCREQAEGLVVIRLEQVVGLLQLAVPQILDVHVHSGSSVVRQIPARMVGIVVDHNRIAVPQPIRAEADIVRSNAPIKVIEPKPLWAAAGQTKLVSLANAAGEVSVSEGLIQMIVRIVAAGVVSHPFVTLGFDVRSRGMSSFVRGEGPLFRSAASRSGRRSAPGRLRGPRGLRGSNT